MTSSTPYTPKDNEFRPCPADEIVAQVGRMNLAAISGLRVIRRETGVTLPVGAGYSVTIDLDWMDEWVVRRTFKRGSKTWIKGEQTRVGPEELGEVAYQASCFRMGDWGDDA